MPALLQPHRLSTPGYQCFSVKFGSFNKEQLAVGTATNFGMKGPGRVYVFSTTQPTPLKVIDMGEAVHDVAWSEQSPTMLVAGSADGTLSLLDLSNPNVKVHEWKRQHGREVSTVDWNMVTRDTIIASSFDGSLSLIDVATGSIQKIPIGNCVYEAVWNPRDASLCSVVCSDGSLRILDMRQQAQVQVVTGAHASEILCTDWNKYDQGQLVTGSVDQQVKVWDMRKLAGATGTTLCNFSGHFRSVRRVKYSPFHRNQISSCGYDMTVRTWNTESLNPVESMPYTDHTEFVIGMSYSLARPGVLASCSWDDSIHIRDVTPTRITGPL